MWNRQLTVDPSVPSVTAVHFSSADNPWLSFFLSYISIVSGSSFGHLGFHQPPLVLHRIFSTMNPAICLQQPTAVFFRFSFILSLNLLYHFWSPLFVHMFIVHLFPLRNETNKLAKAAPFFIFTNV